MSLNRAVMSAMVALLNCIQGLIEVPVDSTYESDIQITVKHDKPLPMKLLAIEVK